MEQQRKKINNGKVRKILLYAYDILIVFVCGYLALVIVEPQYTTEFLNHVLIYSLVCFILTIVLFSFFKLYSSLWKYAGIEEVTKISLVVITIFVINLTFSFISKYIMIRWCIVFSMLQMIACFLVRFIYRLTRIFFRKKNAHKITNDKEKLMIIGAGYAGVLLVKEIRNNEDIKMLPVCFIDDNISKKNMFLEGLKIVGNRNDIPKFVTQYQIDRIIIAIPSLNAKDLAEIIFICQDTKCKVQTLPGIFQMLKDDTSKSSILHKVRDIAVEDLLGRDPIVVDYEEITEYLINQVVLVTGGGGSIGSELCRQIARSKPRQLIILDSYENTAYNIQNELKRKHPDLNLLVLIASVRDKAKINFIFEKYKPNIVYHAAAHKHVPLMETSPHEAVKNNVFGTLNVAEASDKHNVKRFIMISTDKAVNPTSIMGATKRICEMIVQCMNKKSKTEFVATRFGNVLGSNGSVIPLFQNQIENGGPVTVTDKEMVRYFMTISEAVSLVLQAGSYAKGGEIFVLDMGKPVKIYDLAVNLIKLSGYEPEIDIPIEIVGLRPGEKLYEEMLLDEEGLESTQNKLIFIGKPIDINETELYRSLDILNREMYDESTDIKRTVQELVTNYVLND